MSVTLGDVPFSVKPESVRILPQDAGIRSEPHGPAEVGDVLLLGHEVDDRMCGRRVEFGAVRVLKMKDIPRKVHDRHLHSEADSEIRDHMPAGVGRGVNDALDASAAEPAGDDNGVSLTKEPVCGLFIQILRFDPPDRDLRVVGDAAVLQGFHDGEIRIVQGGVFSDERDGDGGLWIPEGADHIFPFTKVRSRRIEMQAVEDPFCKMLFLHDEGHFIQVFHISVLQDVFGRNIAEEGDFIPDARGDRIL